MTDQQFIIRFTELMPNIMTGIMVLAALANGVAALIFYKIQKKKFSTYLKTQGLVSEFVKDRPKDSDGEILWPVIRYRVDGIEYEARNSYGSSSWRIKPGDFVPVIYDRNNPNDAEIENVWMQYLLPIILAAGFVLGSIATPIAHLTMR